VQSYGFVVSDRYLGQEFKLKKSNFDKLI